MIKPSKNQIQTNLNYEKVKYEGTLVVSNESKQIIKEQKIIKNNNREKKKNLENRIEKNEDEKYQKDKNLTNEIPFEQNKNEIISDPQKSIKENSSLCTIKKIEFENEVKKFNEQYKKEIEEIENENKKRIQIEKENKKIKSPHIEEVKQNSQNFELNLEPKGYSFNQSKRFSELKDSFSNENLNPNFSQILPNHFAYKIARPTSAKSLPKNEEIENKLKKIEMDLPIVSLSPIKPKSYSYQILTPKRLSKREEFLKNLKIIEKKLCSISFQNPLELSYTLIDPQ